MTNQRLIGISGIATSGKDSLYDVFKFISGEKNIKILKLAFATKLKDDLNPLIRAQFKFDIYTCSPHQKELIRPLMISYGKVRRKSSNGLYFVRDVEQKLMVEKFPSRCRQLIFITDVRHKEYEYDEIDFIKKHKGLHLHVEKIDKNGKVIEPWIEEEKIFNPILREKADYIIQWRDNLPPNSRVTCIKYDYGQVIRAVFDGIVPLANGSYYAPKPKNKDVKI